MHWRRAAALLLTVAAFEEAAAKLITITEHVSACSAIYTSASRSVTVVKSTVTVSPIPFTDSDANSGTPFILEAQGASPGSKQKRLAAPKLYVTPEGTLTTHGSLAAQYVIQGGKLTTVHGGWISTTHGVTSKQFAISTVAEPIQKTFVVKNGILNWNNAGFTHGTARLYRRGLDVIALFSGNPSPDWKPILLGARPVSDATGAGSGGGTSSISISTAISIGSMSHAPSPTGGHSSVHSGSPGKSSAASGTKVSSAKASSSTHISPSGICGPASGFSCAAGKCCSSYGYCGIGDTYCGAGCQPAYGICSAVSSSSNQGTPSTSVRSSMSSPGGQMSMSSISIGGGSMSHPTSSMPNSAASTVSSSSSSSRASHTTSTYTATATPIGGNNPGASPSFSNTSVSTSMSMVMSSSGSMSTVNPMSSSNAGMTSSSMGMGSTVASMASSSMSMPGISSTSSSAMPSSTLPVSPNGHCGTQGNGGTPDGFTCSGSVFGMCCSNSGFCGNTTDYCLAGCQTTYGSCTVRTGNPITVSGHCGPTAGNQTCTGGIFGPCCSTSGFCGLTADYCDPGNCDPMFGSCDGSSSSTMQMSSTSMSMPMSSSMMSSQTMSSSSSQGMSSSTMSTPSSSTMMLSSSLMASSSSAMMSSSSSARLSSMSSSSSLSSGSSSMMGTTTSSSSGSSSMSSSATPTFTPTSYDPQCPAYNGTGFTDTMGNTYVVLCDKNTDPGAFASSVEPDLGSCINMCSNYSSPACVAVTYVGGTCYFKSAYTGDPNSPANTNSILVLPKLSHNNHALIIPTTASPSSTSTGPYLILTSPTPCDFGDPPDYDEDDSYCEIDLPFPMRIYAQTSTQTYASTNGYLSILEGSSQYEAMQFPTDELPNNTVAPFFDDLYLYGGQTPQQGIFYQFNSAQTAIEYEYYLQRAGSAGAPYHFVVAYDSAVPGVFTFTYYSVGPGDDEGMYAAVGMQGVNDAGTEQGFTYSFQSPDITPGLVVQCDTNADICTTASSGRGKLRR